MENLLRKFIHKITSRCAVVIVAAGSSSRMQGVDKIMYPLSGEPLIMHTIRAFQQCKKISHIVIVTKPGMVSILQEACKTSGFDKVCAVTVGGETRVHSVMRGLDIVPKSCTHVAVHDGARPLVSQQIIEDTVEKAIEYHAAAPAVPVKDTIKVAKKHLVSDTPDRSTLFAVQTPQVFDFDLLRGALTKALQEGSSITDDCSAVEKMGMSVYLTQGSYDNIKVTTPTDLIIAQAIMEGRVKG